LRYNSGANITGKKHKIKKSRTGIKDTLTALLPTWRFYHPIKILSTWNFGNRPGFEPVQAYLALWHHLLSIHYLKEASFFNYPVL
jgi:hypothetical protein